MSALADAVIIITMNSQRTGQIAILVDLTVAIVVLAVVAQLFRAGVNIRIHRVAVITWHSIVSTVAGRMMIMVEILGSWRALVVSTDNHPTCTGPTMTIKGIAVQHGIAALPLVFTVFVHFAIAVVVHAVADLASARRDVDVFVIAILIHIVAVAISITGSGTSAIWIITPGQTIAVLVAELARINVRLTDLIDQLVAESTLGPDTIYTALPTKKEFVGRGDQTAPSTPCSITRFGSMAFATLINGVIVIVVDAVADLVAERSTLYSLKGGNTGL